MALLEFFLLLFAAALSSAVELEEIPPTTSSPLHRRDLSLFDLRSAETFLWGQRIQTDAVLANFTVLMEGDAENILSMERFHGMLKAVTCTDETMRITFVDEESYRYAQRAWDWVNGAANHSFVMVASKGDCGNKHRMPYIVGDIEYHDDAVTADLHAKIAEWSDIAHSYHLKAGSIPSDSFGVLEKRDLGAETSISLNSQFPFKSKVKVGPVSVDLRCDPCYVSGSLGFEFNIVTDNFIPKDIQLKAAPNNIKAEAGITAIFGYAEKKATLAKVPLGNFPLPGGITIPGNILNLGPTLAVEYGADISGQLAISFGTGAVATISDSALLQVDLLNPSNNKFNSWTPKVDMAPAKFDADQLRANVKFNQFIQLAVQLGASVLGKGIGAGLQLKMPYVETKAEFIASNLPGVCSDKPESDVEIKITNVYGVELKFVAGKLAAKSGGTNDVEVSLAAGNFPLGQPICFGWDAPGNPKGTPSAAATPTPKPEPKGNSCKVGKNYASGTCIKTKKCMDQNMVPVPGWCPNDPDNVQCCVEYQGADTCTVGGKTGSCLSRTVCEAADGVSTAGYCPNDPKGIQCCTSKTNPNPNPAPRPPVTCRGIIC